MPVDFSPLMNTYQSNPMNLVDRVETLQRQDFLKKMTLYNFLRQQKQNQGQSVFKDDESYQLPMLNLGNGWGNYG